MLRLTQVVDERILKGLQTQLTAELGMSVVFEEQTNGTMTTIGPRGGVSKSCKEHIDVAGRGMEKCTKSDTNAAWEAMGSLAFVGKGKNPVHFYECNGKMRNFVIPISIGGEVLGCAYGGQFLVDKHKDEERGNLPEMLDRMETEFGMHRQRAIEFATPPSVQEIDEVARANSIPEAERAEFAQKYRIGLEPENLKSLQELMNAVSLVGEVARTISTLGNAYYVKNICLRTHRVVPPALQAELEPRLRALEELVFGIGPESMSDFAERLREINENASAILDVVCTYEDEYVRRLLIPYEENLLPNRAFDQLKARYALGAARHKLGSFEVMLARAHRSLGADASRPHESAHGRLDEELKRLDAALGHGGRIPEEWWQVNRELEAAIAALSSALEASSPPRPGEQHTIEEMEHLLARLTHEKYGLIPIKQSAAEQRVLSWLSEPARSIRADLQLRYDVVYLNMAGISPTSRHVAEAQGAWATLSGGYGPVSGRTTERLEPKEERESPLWQARKAVSQLLNVDPDEILLTANTTHGIELALASLGPAPGGTDGKPGEIILTQQEHDTVRYCCEMSARQRGLKLESVDLSPAEGRGIPQLLAERVNKQTQALVLSHVTYGTGEVLDIQAIAKAIKARAKKLRVASPPILIVDGAQAVGQIPVDVAALDCEFYAADGHKWLMGPIGAGFLWTRNSVLQRSCIPLYKNLMVASKHRPQKTNGEYYESATMNVEPYVGLAAVLRSLLANGQDTYARLLEDVKTGASQFQTLLEKELASYEAEVLWNGAGIVVLRFGGLSSAAVVYGELQRHLEKQFGIVCRSLSDPPGLRFAVHYAVSEEELRITAKAIRRLVEFDLSKLWRELQVHGSNGTPGRRASRASVEALRKRTLEGINAHYAEFWNVSQVRFEKALKTVADDVSLVTRARDRLKEVLAQLEETRDSLLASARAATTRDELLAIEASIPERFHEVSNQ